MRKRTILAIGLLSLSAWGVLRAQKPFKEYPAIEYEDFPLPSDWNKPADWTRARLRYPDITGYPNHSFYRNFAGYWTMDYPRSDRHLLAGVRRLTRIDARAVEQVVSLDGTDEIFNWPMLYAVEVGHWRLPDDQAAQLRDYLNRGGFLMVDDFHASEPYRGVREWDTFMESMQRVFPGRNYEDLRADDPIFHTIYDLDDRFQVPGAQYFDTHNTFEGDPGDSTGKEPHWRAIRDDRGRIVVAICHNMDLGDAWEWSDDPRYNEKWAGLAYRVAMNYFTYDLTH
jgi:hypothetical protein